MSDNGTLRHNEQRVDSPLALWPGYIILPVEIAAAQFDTYWRKLKEQEAAEGEGKGDSGLNDFFRAWQSRWHIVLDWKLDGVKTSQIDETGQQLPSTKIVAWVIHETNKLLNAAWSLPKLPAPSNDTGDSTEPE